MVDTGIDRIDRLLAGDAAQGRWTEGPKRSPVTVIDTLVPFDNLAEREKGWAAFGADPEWTKVRAESIAKHGQVSSVIQMSLWRATPYSPIK